MNILLLGCNYGSNFKGSDKSFYYKLVPLLAERTDKIVIVSINNRKTDVELQKGTGSKIIIYNLRPFYLNLISTDESDECRPSFYKNPTAFFERAITFLKIIPALGQLIKGHKVEAVHFMDNLGPLMRLIKKLSPGLQVSGPAITYKSGCLYDHYLKASFSGVDRIVAFTDAYRLRLIDLGVSPSKVKVIRYGVFVPPQDEIKRSKYLMRTRLDINPAAKIILWSGFLQFMSERDLDIAVKIANIVLQKNQKVKFIFAFKPRNFKREYLRYASKQLKIEESSANFPDLENISDVLLSPFYDTHKIIGPPLTWLECMSRGIPIITTKVGGAGEIVRNEETGYIVDSVEEMAEAILKLLADESLLRCMSMKSRRVIEEKYSIKNAADLYANLWSND